MTKTPFLKMHGTGNDFVVLDARAQPLVVDAALAQRLCHRHFGIGCDTLVVLQPPQQGGDVAVAFYNADGSQSPTCGNASRCVADLLMRERGVDAVQLETLAGLLPATRAADGSITVNMGSPKLEWQQIPLAESRNTMHLGLQDGLLMDPVAVNMGNPHAIFFVRDLAHIKLAEAGPRLEHHPLFPQRANISAVQVLAPDRLRMAVWERGAGLTMACGSAACAAVVAGALREVSLRKATVELPGGTLEVEWTAEGDVRMSGAVAYVFNGEIAL